MVGLPQWPRGVTCSFVEPGSGSDHCLVISLSVPTVKYSDFRLSAIVFIVILNWIFYLFFCIGEQLLFLGASSARARAAHQTVYIPAPFLVGTIKKCL